MPLCTLQWFSNVLRKSTTTSILLPSVGSGPYATYYLLHGLSDDHSAWCRRTSIERYVDELPLIVVMPDGYRGFYTDNEDGPAYARHFAEELVGMIEKTFPAKKSRSARAVGGLSMGGYGALRLALGYGDLFASANSHSGALLAGTRPRDPAQWPEARQWFGKKPAGSGHDLLKLARDAKAASKLPKIRIDCGVDDFLIADNREFHAKLTALGVPHEYEEFPGVHEWDYWDAHIREALAFHAKNLKLPAVKK